MVFSEFLQEIKKEKLNEKASKKVYNYSNNIIKKAQDALDDIDLNRNHSLAIEIYNRNKDNLNNIALKYRGIKITYKDMFEKSFIYAKALRRLGFKKGSEIPMCITNIPEFIYLFLATSFIGAQANIVGSWFDKEYLTTILNNTNSKVMFIDDISYDLIKDSIKNSNIEELVCFSLTDSFKTDKEGQKINYYDEIDSKFHPIVNNVEEIKKKFNGKVLDTKYFENISLEYVGKVIENVELDDICSITYTSGTTNPGCPKGVIQANRSYITLSRFKESDVSDMPTMKNMSVLAHIPTYTHMELSCAISDTLYCRCELDLEPFYSKEFFPYSLMINKPNFVPASVGFWGHLCKLLNFDRNFQKVNMPYLMIPTVTGEGMSQGEEKFFNFTSRKHKFGTEKLPFPLAPVTFSIGGGTTESSGIFVTLFKALQEKKLNYLLKKETLGLTPHKFADIEVLDENGKYCDINEPGLLVSNNPCEMIGYTDEKLNKYMYVTDAYGHKWLSLDTCSFKDRTGRIKMKGRMDNYIIQSNGQKIPLFKIEDTVLVDTKNIMSCSIVKIEDKKLVCHIELQPYKKRTINDIVKGIVSRIDNIYCDEVKNQLYFRIRDNNESFPLDPSGKRSISTLKKIGIDEKTLPFDVLKNSFDFEDIDQNVLIKSKQFK